jgi:hypothetical protein
MTANAEWCMKKQQIVGHACLSVVAQDGDAREGQARVPEQLEGREAQPPGSTGTFNTRFTRSAWLPLAHALYSAKGGRQYAACLHACLLKMAVSFHLHLQAAGCVRTRSSWSRTT